MAALRDGGTTAQKVFRRSRSPRVVPYGFAKRLAGGTLS